MTKAAMMSIMMIMRTITMKIMTLTTIMVMHMKQEVWIPTLG
jgi:hypothetical protein